MLKLWSSVRSPIQHDAWPYHDTIATKLVPFPDVIWDCNKFLSFTEWRDENQSVKWMWTRQWRAYCSTDSESSFDVPDPSLNGPVPSCSQRYERNPSILTSGIETSCFEPPRNSLSWNDCPEAAVISAKFCLVDIVLYDLVQLMQDTGPADGLSLLGDL